MKQILLFILFPFITFGQIQIGFDIDGEAVDDLFGYSVSLSSDGTFVAIGAYDNDGSGSNSGHVRVYENQSGVWTQIGNDIDGEASGDNSGVEVSLSSNGTVLAIGALSNDGNGSNSGHVRVFEIESGVWTQIGSDIDGEAPSDNFGLSLSLSSDGKIIAIGAGGNDGNGPNSGHVRVFKIESGVWTQIGSDIDGEAANDGAGLVSLSSNGTVLAIGATFNDGNGSDSGHVRVYENQSDIWVQIGNDIDGEAPGDFSGRDVAISSDGTILAIGALSNDGNGSNSGHVRVFRMESGVWIQIGSDIDGESPFDLSGLSLSLSSDGTVVAIGGYANDGNGSNSGHVRVYEYQGNVWVQRGNDIDGEAANDQAGFSVSLSSDGTVVAVGANTNDGNGSNSGHVRVYDLGSVLSSDEFEFSQFQLYPNPAKEQFTIQLSPGVELLRVTVHNSLGQFISSTVKNVINTSHLSNGVYHIKIETNNGQSFRKIMIK